MLFPDQVDIPTEVFGGYCPAIPPSDLSPGAAAIAQDVIFPQGAVRTRGGLRKLFTVGSPIPGNAAINGLKSYITPSLGQRLMAWDSLGNLYKENPQGTLTLIASRPYTNLFYQSTTLFGREYQAFFNALGGFDLPRQYDDTNWDRVSQVGPGSNMTVVDAGTAGSIAVGKHQFSVAFITRQSYITMCAVPKSWTAAGGFQATVTGIPLGPTNVVARLLLFSPVIVSPATAGTLYSLPAGSSLLASSVMLINDNTTTTATIDFSDAILSAGFNANYLLTQVEIGQMSSFQSYNSRLVALGERNRISNMVNMSFDGGAWVANVPGGWTGVSAGGGRVINGTEWADAYSIAGDGATASRGKITQSAYLDYLGVPIIARNVAYSIRARVARSGALAQGTLHINLSSVSQAFTTVGLSVTAAQAGINFAEFTATLTDVALISPPSDLLLNVYADGTPTNLESFVVDSIEIYPTLIPFNYSTARFSYAFNPEAFGSTTGQLQLRPNDGQQLRASFPLRNNLYLAKDHYLAYVADDGINEPSSWAVNEVSGTVGICGPNAVDWTEEWAVFAERSGLYICWGSDPVKLTPEIQIDASGSGQISWASINWQYAHTIWVRIDRANKMILIGAPVNGATSPNIVFMLDYRWLETAEDIASSPLITFSGFSGKILSHGRGRRWALWNITANSMTFAERSDGTAQPFFGNGAGNGKIYQQFDCATQGSDDGAAIPWTYQGYGCPSHIEEQQYQLGAHRKLAGYLKFRAIGSGVLPLSISTTQRSTLLRSYTLSTSPSGDGERPLNLHGERFYVTIRTNSVAGSWFQLEKLVLCVRKEACIPVRGVSA